MLRWFNSLHEMKNEEKRMEVERQKTVSRMIKSADGSTGLWHKITMPTPWRGGVQILKEEEEDATPLARFEEKRKERTKHWHCGTDVQDQKDKPWRCEELKKSEELKEIDLAKAAKTCKAKTGGCGGFHPKVPLASARETRGEGVEILEKVEQC